MKEQLTCTDTVLLKSDRLVIPATLQERIVDIAHEGHLGIVKIKALPREKVWFPFMDEIVETKVKACLLCQVVTPVCIREPRQMSVLPDSPFDEISVDFAHVGGQILLLVVDDYSRFPFVEPVSSTSASAVIPKLDQLLSQPKARIAQSQRPRRFSRICTHQLLTREMMSLRTVALALQLTRSVFMSHHPLLKVQIFLVQIHQTLRTPSTSKMIY